MSYSVFSNDIIEVDRLIEQIKGYRKSFQEYENSFSHCKNVEQFESKLQIYIPDLRYKITEIYCSGRDLAIAVPSFINEYLTIENTRLLKTGIDNLESQLIAWKEWGESEHSKVSTVYNDSDYNDWSINIMLSSTLEMCKEIDEILIHINIIKSSCTYQVQSKTITPAEAYNLMKAQVNTINNNNSGNFENSQVSNGDSNTNTMTVNQTSSEELVRVCERLADIIDKSSAKTEEKDAVKEIVYELKETKNVSELRSVYNKLTSAMSTHITIGTAILSSEILPILTNLIM